MCGDNKTAPEQGIEPRQVIASVKYVTRRGKRTDGSLGYKIYMLLWRSFFVRRVYFRLRRLFHGS